MALENYNYSPCMFIGETLEGIAQPVPFDPHSCVWNNRPGGTVIFGSPGSGKTFLAMTIAALAALLGKRVVVVDPKNDFLQLLELREELGNVQVLDLSATSRNRTMTFGVLDPYYMDVGEKRVELAATLVELFLGTLSSEQQVILDPILRDVGRSKNPSMLLVQNMLNRHEDNVGKSLGTQLGQVSRTEFGRLCFAPTGDSERPALTLGKGLTIISLGGLEISPDPEAKDLGSRVASGIMYLITYFLEKTMRTDTSGVPKLIIIDEAHAIMASDAGRRKIKSIALLGRSLNTAIVLITQNITHLNSMDLESAISNRFAFGTSADQAEAIIKSMDLPAGHSYEKSITALKPGQCLMKDSVPMGRQKGRVGLVQIVQWNARWKDKFETNPRERARKSAAKAKEKERLNLSKSGMID